MRYFALEICINSHRGIRYYVRKEEALDALVQVSKLVPYDVQVSTFITPRRFPVPEFDLEACLKAISQCEENETLFICEQIKQLLQ